MSGTSRQTWCSPSPRFSIVFAIGLSGPGGRDELDPPGAVAEDRDPHLLGRDLLDLGELEAVDVAVELHGGVEVGDEDGDVIESGHARAPTAKRGRE